MTTTPPGGDATAMKFTYDADGKVLTASDITDTVLATVSYTTGQELDAVTYTSDTALSEVTRDAAGRTIGHSWSVAGETITDAVARSQSGRIVQHITSRGAQSWSSTYGYDTAGRLVSASIPGHQLTYGFGAASCGANTAAGKSGNRTSLIDVHTPPGGSAVTSTTAYCYDFADRLTSTTVTNPVVGANTVTDGLAPAEVAYDEQGNTIRLADMQLSYDAAGRHVGTTYDDGSVVSYLRDVAGRVIQSTTTPAGGDPVVVKYLYAGGADAAWGQTTGTTLTRTIALPGGVSQTVTGSEVTWAFPNLQGHTLVTRTGTTTGAVLLWDPFGQPLHPVTLAIGTAPSDDTGTVAGNTGWHQGALKQAATVGSMAVVQMGARVYVPALGRFLQVDPIEGGVDNDYVWPTDPINKHDLSGRIALPLIPLLVLLAAVLLIAGYIIARNPPKLPPVSISIPQLPKAHNRSASPPAVQAIVVPRPAQTTCREKDPYRVYEVRTVGSNETWKYGITSGAPFDPRPSSQHKDCEAYFGTTCTHIWRANATGYYNARLIEYEYIMNYVMIVGSCPPGQLMSCK